MVDISDLEEHDDIKACAQLFLDEYVKLCQKYDAYLVATPLIKDGRIVVATDRINIQGQTLEIRNK